MRTLLWLCACVSLAASAPAVLSGQQSEGATAPDEGTYEVSQAEVVPRLRNRDRIIRSLAEFYPPTLRDAGIGAAVVVRWRIMENGTVERASIHVVSTTDARFDKAAKQVVGRMIFTPGLIDGRPVKLWAEQTFTFDP